MNLGIGAGLGQAKSDVEKVLGVEFDLDLPWRVMLGVNNSIVHVERRDVADEIGFHEPLEAIRQCHVERRLHRFASLSRAEPVIVAEQKARSVMSRRVQNWKYLNPFIFSSLPLFT